MNAKPQAGFTLLELVVTMGILTGFLLLLTQLVGGGVTLFRDGETAQILADGGEVARAVLTRELSQLRADAPLRDRAMPTDRLLVQELPIGLPARAEPRSTLVQLLRAAVRLAPERELELQRTMLATRVGEEHSDWSETAQAEEVARLLAATPLRGIGSMLLLPWRQEGDDDALLELRAGWLLPGQEVPVGRGEFRDPLQVVVPGGSDLPALVVHAITQPILRDLLHVEWQFWGQTTSTWREMAGASPSLGAGSGPYRIWDSARAGWLVDRAAGGVFALDKGSESWRNTDDDVQPHAMLVRVVTAMPVEQAPEGLLADGIGADDERLVLVDGDQFPGSESGGWVKVDGEWLEYGERDGDVLLGLRRGMRRTKPIEHQAGVRVHVGRTVEFVLPIPHGKDDWNG